MLTSDVDSLIVGEIYFLHSAPDLFSRFLLLLRHTSCSGTIAMVTVAGVPRGMEATIVIAAASRLSTKPNQDHGHPKACPPDLSVGPRGGGPPVDYGGQSLRWLCAPLRGYPRVQPYPPPT